MQGRAPRRYLIDRLFPHSGVHLIGGPSGAGKTRWLFQTLIDQWEKGQDVLGFKSHPCPWLYVSGDRILDDAYETLEDLGYNPDRIRMLGAVDEGITNIEGILHESDALKPRPQLLVIEGIASLAPAKCDINNYKHVSAFLSTLVRMCKKADVGLWGVCHSPKMKEDSQYLNPRQRIMGSAAWAAYSGTVVMVEPLGYGTEVDHQRKLIVLPRRGAGIYMNLQFNADGRLVEAEGNLNDALFEAFLHKYRSGETFKTADVLAALESRMSRYTVQRILDAAISGGYVERIGQGTYRIRPIS